ncbi:hypothetical protein APT63_11500 [Pseudomonas sp. 22-AL-CL-001]|nr:hypothetical protein APT63_11500 [Pseudomonas monteilii]
MSVRAGVRSADSTSCSRSLQARMACGLLSSRVSIQPSRHCSSASCGQVSANRPRACRVRVEPLGGQGIATGRPLADRLDHEGADDGRHQTDAHLEHCRGRYVRGSIQLNQSRQDRSLLIRVMAGVDAAMARFHGQEIPSSWCQNLRFTWR